MLFLLLPALLAQPVPVHADSVLITLIGQVEIAARDQGVISQIEVREGQLVKQGDVLVQLDNTEARLAVKKAQLEFEIARCQAGNDVKVRFAEKSLDVAKAELRRANEAGEKFRNSVSQTELDQLKLTTQRGELEIEQAKHELEVARLTAALKQNELEAARLALDRRTIRSPIEGTVTKIKHHLGESVQPNDVLARVIQLDRLRAEGFVSGKETLALAGQHVTLLVDLPGRPKTAFRGRLTFVDPETNAVSGQVRVWAEIDNPDLLLRPGLTAAMTLETPSTAAEK